MFNKSIYLQKKVKKGNFYFSNKSLKICWLFKGMEVMKNLISISLTYKNCKAKKTRLTNKACEYHYIVMLPSSAVHCDGPG